MAPKKGKKAKKESKETIGGDVEGTSLEELSSKISILEREKNKEEEYRSYMQLERDKVNSFWEIAKHDVRLLESQLHNKDRELEEMEERHQVELKVYKQKVKHLLYEHQNNITTLKSDTELALKLQQESFVKEDKLQGKRMRQFSQDIKEQELSHQDIIRQLKLENSKQITKLRQEFENQAQQIQNKYEMKMRMMREDLEMRKKKEVLEIEECKNSHINELLLKHERVFSDIKNYYNDITHNNLDLIKTLKGDVTTMKKKEAQNEKLMFEIAQENKRLSEPLSKALKEVEFLRSQFNNYEKDKEVLQQTKTRLQKQEQTVKNLQWEKEVMNQYLSKIQTQRDDLHTSLDNYVQDLQHKQGLQNLLLTKKTDEIKEQLNRKEAELVEVLATCDIESNTLTQLRAKVGDMFENKVKLVETLQYDVAKISKAHNDLIRVYEGKLQEFGMATEDLGFKPLFSKTSKNPAGLIVGV
eukprot:TRINITY_DN2907_c0_g1_i1.p1 TRINITY_DN2907_c0_g1~~TRINITY_DN2907_c0_g1_i1.p1  ORF type:complete len:471 (-),score=93.65 TRINITY_DN2907_c0_g1_i1:347-1759(-)